MKPRSAALLLGALSLYALSLVACSDEPSAPRASTGTEDWASASCIDAGAPRVEICVHPAAAEVDSAQTLVFRIEVGEEGIAPGGSVEIEFPSAMRGPLADYLMPPPQTRNPALFGYASACLTSDALACPAPSLPVEGLEETARVTLPDGARPGEYVRVQIQTRMRKNAGRISWKLQLDIDGDQRPDLGSGATRGLGPEFEFEPAPAAYVVLTAPADVAVGEAFSLWAVAHDRFGNLARAGSVATPLRLLGEDVSALPASLSFETMAIAHVDGVAHQTSGLRSIRAHHPTLPVYSHYSFAHEAAPERRRYFGDTHFHTGTITGHRWRDQKGGDHYGHYTEADQAYAFAADVERLDFASLAEHDIGHTRAGWESAQEETRRFDGRPGFTAFRAYEWTPKHWSEPGVGAHQVILYRGDGGEVISAEDEHSRTLGMLVDSLESQAERFTGQGGDAHFMLIPHPMGTSDLVADGPHPIFQRGLLDPRYTHVTEFHSRHRLRRQDRDYHPQVYEGQGDAPETHTLQYAWAVEDLALDKPRWHLGVVGSSDNHSQMPGSPSYAANLEHAGSLAVLLAPENTRTALWETLEARRSYGTTGERIYVSLHIAGADLGERIVHAGPRSIELAVGGTAALEEVSILRAKPGHGFELWWTATEFEREDALRVSLVDADPILGDGEWIYYARVRQRPIGISDRPQSGLAITSPIWVRSGGVRASR